MTDRVIAIDGPAASGKSSTAAAVARALGFVHVDSGALYRALTWVASHHGLDTATAILAAAGAAHVGWHFAPTGALEVRIDGLADAEAAIRAPEVNALVSTVAAMPEVRDWVNARIRDVIHQLPGAVVDGRDIGTVVLPQAQLKIFLTATPEARATRRLAQRGERIDPGELMAETAALVERDRRDSARAVAPLREARDAVRIDTTAMSFAGQVSEIVARAAAVGLTA